MSFAQDNGYTPMTFDQIMSQIREGINAEFGTSYTPETFVGTNWYKYMYPLVQKVQEGEIKTSEIFQKLQQYIALTNQRIQRPSVSAPGIVDSFQSRGWVASVKPPDVEDAGLIYICVDVDDQAPDYSEKKLEICNLIKDFIAAGIVSQGTEVESLVLSNGQSFDFAFNLPNRIPVLLKLTCTVSQNNLLAIPNDEVIRQTVFDQIKARYRLGWDFEPQRYFTLNDAPWASTVLLEWSDDNGGNWYSTVYSAEYTDLFEFGINDIQVVVSS